MAGERRRVAGELAAWHLCGVVMLISGKALNPQHLNPYRERRAVSEKMQRVKERMAQISWRVLTRGNRAD